ncbi:MAG: hypothetical protein SOX71_03830 [Candidatus Faecousia sp.]|nr:hypothetical protein [Candidatus Faecousia sp.]
MKSENKEEARDMEQIKKFVGFKRDFSASWNLAMIRTRVRSGMANARAKGKQIGRPQITKDSISTTHMSHIETGNTKLSLPVFVDIAVALEVRTDDLLDNPATATTSTSLDEIATVLERCSAQEAKVIADVVKATKRSIDKHL